MLSLCPTRLSEVNVHQIVWSWIPPVWACAANRARRSGILSHMISPRLLTEFIGTFFLVLIIGLASAAAGASAPISIGIGLVVLVYMGAHISGAQYNPAVAIAVWLAGGQDARRTLAYILAQMAGAIGGALVAKLLLGSAMAVMPPEGKYPVASVLLAEGLATFLLCLVILNVAMHPKTKGNAYFGFAIGGTVLACAYAFGPISGGAFNPAVGLGPAIVSAISGGPVTVGVSWVYLVGPVLGAIVAALVFRAQTRGD